MAACKRRLPRACQSSLVHGVFHLRAALPENKYPGMRKCTILQTIRDRTFMDAEHINTISNQLADLSNRVNELRGYL